MTSKPTVQVDRRVFVRVQDGTRIALTVYLPEGDGPFPTVVESLPYRKDDDCTARDYATFSHLASQGIAGVRIDVRGTGASTGIIENEYLPVEQRDNIEVLDWIVDQPWSNGRVGMWGISWGGFSALQTAMLRPPQLKAILVMHATHDRFSCDVHYVGGSLHGAEQVDWPPSMITTNALPPDPDIVGETWKDEWLERLDKTPQWPFEWFRHQTRDEFWEHGSPSVDYSSIECPTLLIGGWLDGYVDGMLALASNLECPTRTVIGPWGHYRPATGKPGPTYDHFELMARWFGHHLRGDDNGVMDMPAVTAFIRTGTPYDPDSGDVAGHWREESAWPPPDTMLRRIAIDTWSHGATNWDGPQWVGSHAPAWDRSGISSGNGQPDDRHAMTFDSAPLSEPLEVLGTPELSMTISTDQDLGMVAARLLVVSPSGDSHLITRGNRNLVFRDGFEYPRPPGPGERLTVTFPLMATSAVIPAGSRIRLALSGADFPVVWPPKRSFTLEVWPEQSSLTLPIVDRQDEVILDIPAGPPPFPPPVADLGSTAEWAIERHDGTTIFTRHISSAELQPTREELTYTTEQSWTVRVADDDPGTTAVDAKSHLKLERTGWKVETLGSISIAGRDQFEVVIHLEAWHNDTQVWSRKWSELVDRKWV